MRPDYQAITYDMEPRTLKVWVCGDVHVGAEGFQMAAFESFIQSVEDDPDAFIVFLGDLMDNATRNSKGEVFIGMTPSEQMEYIARTLAPLAKAGKILAIVAGNHELRSAKDTDIEPLYNVCVRLGIEKAYRRDFAAIRIRMRLRRAIRVYNLIAFHGASDAKVRQMANNVEGFDAILTAHSHQPVARIPAHLTLTQRGFVIMKDIVQVTGCSWCDYVGYGARGLYQPQTQSRPQCLILEWDACQRHQDRISVSW